MAMNEAIHQLLQLILQGLTWVVKTVEALWVWSWAQIASAFSMSWGNLPTWKIAFGVIAIAILAAIPAVMCYRGLEAFGTTAAAFWTMVVTRRGTLTVV